VLHAFCCLLRTAHSDGKAPAPLLHAAAGQPLTVPLAMTFATVSQRP